MVGNLEPDERILSELSVLEKINHYMYELEWNGDDRISVEVGGSSVYEIDGAGTKWAPVKGTRKYNKDAFIVIKNLDRNQ